MGGSNRYSTGITGQPKPMAFSAAGAVVAQGLGAYSVWALVLSGSAAHMRGFEARVKLNSRRLVELRVELGPKGVSLFRTWSK
jgi:hypothetical protein